MPSWVNVRAARRTDPPTVIPYKGYIHVGPSFSARFAIQHIVDRVETDYPVGTLAPLIDLIDAVNVLGTVQTTHTAASHRIGKNPELATSLIVMPQGEVERPSWWDNSDVGGFATRFSHHLGQRFESPFPPGRFEFYVGPIEVIVDPGGHKTLGYGLEFQIVGRGRTIPEVTESWQWPIFALSEHMRSMEQSTDGPARP